MRFGHFFYPMKFDDTRDEQEIQDCLREAQLVEDAIIGRDLLLVTTIEKSKSVTRTRLTCRDLGHDYFDERASLPPCGELGRVSNDWRMR